MKFNFFMFYGLTKLKDYEIQKAKNAAKSNIWIPRYKTYAEIVCLIALP